MQSQSVSMVSRTEQLNRLMGQIFGDQILSSQNERCRSVSIWRDIKLIKSAGILSRLEVGVQTNCLAIHCIWIVDCVIVGNQRNPCQGFPRKLMFVEITLQKQRRLSNQSQPFGCFIVRIDSGAKQAVFNARSNHVSNFFNTKHSRNIHHAGTDCLIGEINRRSSGSFSRFSRVGFDFPSQTGFIGNQSPQICLT